MCISQCNSGVERRRRYLLSGFLRRMLSCVLSGVQPVDNSRKDCSNRCLNVFVDITIVVVLLEEQFPVVCVH